MLHKPYFCNVVIKNVSCTLYDFNCEQLSHTDDVEVLKTHKDTQLDLKGSIISRPKGKKKKKQQQGIKLHVRICTYY